MTKPKKKEWEEKFDEVCLKLSYKHNNEITLAIDDLHKLFSTLLKQQKQELKEKVKKVSGAVIKGTGKRWLVVDYVRRDDILKLL